MFETMLISQNRCLDGGWVSLPHIYRIPCVCALVSVGNLLLSVETAPLVFPYLIGFVCTQPYVQYLL